MSQDKDVPPDREMSTPSAATNLEPWGRLLTGEEGVSAARIADALDVPVALIKRLAQPIGRMKMPYRNPFDVYDAQLVETLRDYPEVRRSQERRRKRQDSAGAFSAVQTRREKRVAHLAAAHPDLEDLYKDLVEKLWSPRTEKALKTEALYQDLPALLWHAYAPAPEAEATAREVVVDILWAMTKVRTWKVDEDGDQDTPLVWDLWHSRAPVEGHEEAYQNVFAAAIRHKWFNTGEKFAGREQALKKLQEISLRRWPAGDGGEL